MKYMHAHIFLIEETLHFMSCYMSWWITKDFNYKLILLFSLMVLSHKYNHWVYKIASWKEQNPKLWSSPQCKDYDTVPTPPDIWKCESSFPWRDIHITELNLCHVPIYFTLYFICPMRAAIFYLYISNPLYQSYIITVMMMTTMMIIIINYY